MTFTLEFKSFSVNLKTKLHALKPTSEIDNNIKIEVVGVSRYMVKFHVNVSEKFTIKDVNNLMKSNWGFDTYDLQKYGNVVSENKGGYTYEMVVLV